MSRISSLFFATLIAAVPNATAATYQLDDGTVSASGFGLGHFGTFTSVWLNAFQVAPGMETITGVSIMFGAAPIGDGQPANGTPINVLLYTDPNNDGNPLDGVLQRQVAGTIQVADTGTFVDFSLTSITLTPGAWFYVGMSQAAPGNTNVFGANIDSDVFPDPSPQGRSYLLGWFSGTPDITALSGSSASTHTAIDGDFMIRATADGVAETPEPSTLLLTGAAALALALKRKHRLH